MAFPFPFLSPPIPKTLADEEALKQFYFGQEQSFFPPSEPAPAPAPVQRPQFQMFTPSGPIANDSLGREPAPSIPLAPYAVGKGIPVPPRDAGSLRGEFELPNGQRVSVSAPPVNKHETQHEQAQRLGVRERDKLKPAKPPVAVKTMQLGEAIYADAEKAAKMAAGGGQSMTMVEQKSTSQSQTAQQSGQRILPEFVSSLSAADADIYKEQMARIDKEAALGQELSSKRKLVKDELASMAASTKTEMNAAKTAYTEAEKLAKKYETASDTPIDVNRYWRRQNPAQTIVQALALAVGGFVEGFTEGRMQNVAARIIDRAVDRDIAEQEAEQRKNTDLGKTYRQAMREFEGKFTDAKGAYTNEMLAKLEQQFEILKTKEQPGIQRHLINIASREAQKLRAEKEQSLQPVVTTTETKAEEKAVLPKIQELQGTMRDTIQALKHLESGGITTIMNSANSVRGQAADVVKRVSNMMPRTSALTLRTMTPAEEVEVRGMVESLAANYIKSISGAASTEAEQKRLASVLVPSTAGWTTEKQLRLLNAFIRVLDRDQYHRLRLMHDRSSALRNLGADFVKRQYDADRESRLYYGQAINAELEKNPYINMQKYSVEVAEPTPEEINEVDRLLEPVRQEHLNRVHAKQP